MKVLALRARTFIQVSSSTWLGATSVKTAVEAFIKTGRSIYKHGSRSFYKNGFFFLTGSRFYKSDPEVFLCQINGGDEPKYVAPDIKMKTLDLCAETFI